MKKSSIRWLVVIAGFGLSFSVALFYIAGPEAYVSMGKNPWVSYIHFSLSLFSMGIFPLFVIVLTSSSILIECQSNSWKSLFSLPIPKWHIMLGKLIAIFFMMLVVCSLFVISTVLIGYIVDCVVREYEFVYYDANISSFLLKVFRLFIVTLGILGVQFLFSVLFRNQLYPLVLGIILCIIGFMMSILELRFTDFFPYSFPMVYEDFGITNTGPEPGHAHFLGWIELMSLICLMGCLVLAYQRFKRLR